MERQETCGNNRRILAAIVGFRGIIRADAMIWVDQNKNGETSKVFLIRNRP